MNSKIESDEGLNISQEISSQTSFKTVVPKKDRVETYFLDSIKIIVKQNWAPKDNYHFSCISTISTFLGSASIDSLDFDKIEAVGGLAGFSNPEIILNHLILTKEGDYNGRTIVINEKGEIFDFIGGINYLDSEKMMLYSIYSSDLAGIGVYNLNSDQLIYSSEDMEDRPFSVHKEFGNRIFYSCENDETEVPSIWELETELDRIMQIDLDSTDIHSKNKLKMINLERF